MKLDILIGIPTLNEEDSISNVVSKIDQGILKYFPDFKTLIVNLDSNSKDNTRENFLKTKTKTPKISLITSKTKKGKGRNLLKLFKLAKKYQAKYIATFDGDIVSISEKWIKLMIEPLIKKEADFVAPIYRRNRYEATITNHFCYPLILAWFRKELSQPIAGEFSMNKKFINYILKQPLIDGALFYGIDIFLSLHALGGKFKTKGVFLGKKIHKPSFPKLKEMFFQVAQTTFFVISSYPKRKNHLKFISSQIDRIDQFIRKPNKKEITDFQKQATIMIKKTSFKKINQYLGVSNQELKKILKNKIVDQQIWLKILEKIINYLASSKIKKQTSKLLAELLLPFFMLRVVFYFSEIEDKNIFEVEKIIKNQAKKLALKC